jgi:tetratricopeptide (TPR) repeat protein
MGKKNLELNQECKYKCKTKINYEKITFSDGFIVFVPREESGKIHHCKIFENNLESKGMNEGLDIVSKDYAKTKSIEEEAYDFDDSKWLEAMKKIVTILPTNRTFFYDLGEAYNELGKFEDALIAHNIMHEINPYFYWNWLAKTNKLFELEREPEIILFLEEILKKFYKNAKIKKNIEKKFHIEPIGAEILLSILSDAYYRIRNNPKALEIIQKSLKIFEKNNVKNSWNEYELYQNYGKILLAERRNKEAKDAFEKSLKSKPVMAFENKSIIEENKNLEKTPKTDSEKIEELELMIKNLIVDVMEKYPKWEEDPNRIPQTEWKIAKQRQKDFEEDPLMGGKYRIIDFVDFSDYVRIINHKKNWEKLFEPIFKNKFICLGYLTSVQKLRNAVAHHRGNEMNKHLDSNQKGHLHELCKYFSKSIEKYYYSKE